MKYMKVNIIEITIFLIVTIIAVFTIIAICVNQSHRISEGIVVDRYYRSGYSTVASKNQPSVYHPPKYSLTISGMKNGEYVEYTFDVPEAEYVKYNIGDYYPK